MFEERSTVGYSGQWFNYVVTYDGGGISSGRIDHYRNGVFNAGQNYVGGSGTMHQGNGRWVLLNREAGDRGSQNYFIAEVGVWDTVLTSGQISNLAAGRLPSSIPNNLQLYFPLRDVGEGGLTEWLSQTPIAGNIGSGVFYEGSHPPVDSYEPPPTPASAIWLPSPTIFAPPPALAISLEGQSDWAASASGNIKHNAPLRSTSFWSTFTYSNVTLRASLTTEPAEFEFGTVADASAAVDLTGQSDWVFDASAEIGLPQELGGTSVWRMQNIANLRVGADYEASTFWVFDASGSLELRSNLPATSGWEFGAFGQLLINAPASGQSDWEFDASAALSVRIPIPAARSDWEFDASAALSQRERISGQTDWEFGTFAYLNRPLAPPYIYWSLRGQRDHFHLRGVSDSIYTLTGERETVSLAGK